MMAQYNYTYISKVKCLAVRIHGTSQLSHKKYTYS